jgi:membrane-anchored protein YejM (alkaline phosphatase superfamily)
MLSEPVRVANTREHISWSHRFAFFWLVLTLVLFGGAYAFAEIGRDPAPHESAGKP